MEIQNKYTEYNLRERKSDQQKRINFNINELSLFDSLDMSLNFTYYSIHFNRFSLFEKNKVSTIKG